MSMVVVGLNHKTAPVGLLEQLAIGPDDLPKALHQLDTYEHVLEGVVLSTCNRIEVYALVSKFHGGAQDIRNFFAEFCHVAPEEFTDHLYTYHDDGAIRHLFRVAAGIDSMVVGESEILGQVRRAYQVAEEEGVVHRVMGAAFRQAFRVGKRARTETAVGRNPVSISSAAVELAKRAFEDGTLSGKKVVIVGAGKMGGLAADALASSGAQQVTVVNRTEERAQALADRMNVESMPFEQLEQAIAMADILICSTTAPQAVVDRPLLERAMQDRGRQLFIVDIAVPRDVDPTVGEVPGVVLRDIDDLRGVVEAGIGSRVGEISKVEEILSEELQRFVTWERAGEIAPTISALVSKADAVRAAELEVLKRKLATLSPEEMDAVDHLTRRIISKLLHVPISRAKEVASSKQGYLYLNALRELFELEDEPGP
jgi:glutamyl-tRNA reductase